MRPSSRTRPNHCEFQSFHYVPVCLYFVYAILTCPDARSMSVSFCVDNVCSAHCAPLYNLIQVFTHNTLVHTHTHSQIRTLSPMLQQIPCVLYSHEFVEVLVCAKTCIHAHTIQCATCVCVLGTDALSTGVGGWVGVGRAVGRSCRLVAAKTLVQHTASLVRFDQRVGRSCSRAHARKQTRS